MDQYEKTRIVPQLIYVTVFIRMFTMRYIARISRVGPTNKDIMNYIMFHFEQ